VELLCDERPEFFVESMAGARLVVLPLLKDAVTQAGIGVYISAMALRKCVIISSGLGVDDVLLDDQAMIVPAGDAAALRDAIRLAWESEEVREKYAGPAYEYAMALGDANNLRRSILEALPAR
jgi:glycosyltransferase involved in cell wall biosynthesis